MSKKWYTVSFSAKMSEDDVRAMKNYFYETMQESMNIGPCVALDIELEDDQDDECPLGGDISNDCADCAYACDYHYVDGECVRRED